MAGRIQRALKLVENLYGKSQAKRLEQASDEVDLSRWNPRDLVNLFGSKPSPIPGDTDRTQNAGVLMAMPPGQFENYARPILDPTRVPYNRWSNVDTADQPRLGQQTLDNYVRQLGQKLKTEGGLDLPSELWLSRVIDPNAPSQVEGHEGRHHMRWLDQLGDKAGLVNIKPNSDLAMTGQSDEVLERLLGTYFPQGDQSLVKPERMPFALPGPQGQQRQPLLWPNRGFAEGGALQRFDDGGDVEGRPRGALTLAGINPLKFINFVKKITGSPSQEKAVGKVLEHTEKTGNEALIHGREGDDLVKPYVSKMTPGTETSVKPPPSLRKNLFADTPGQPWSIHTHPSGTIIGGDKLPWSVMPSSGDIANLYASRSPWALMNKTLPEMRIANQTGNQVRIGGMHNAFDPNNLNTRWGENRDVNKHVFDLFSSKNMFGADQDEMLKNYHAMDDWAKTHGVDWDSVYPVVRTNPKTGEKKLQQTLSPAGHDLLSGNIYDRLGQMGIPVDLTGNLTSDPRVPLEDAMKSWAEYAATRNIGPRLTSSPEQLSLGFAEGGAVQKFGGKLSGLVKAGEGALNKIRTYTGSPYTFDKFDPAKIGSGEGSAAYGHGFYSAQNPQVAQEYRRITGGKGDSPGQWLINGVPDDLRVRSTLEALAKQHYGYWSPETMEATREIERLRAQGFEPDAIANMLSKRGMMPPMDYEKTQKIFQGLPPGYSTKKPGWLYSLDLNAHPSQFLDWDAPLDSRANDRIMQTIADKHPGVVDSIADHLDWAGKNSPWDVPEDYSGRQLHHFLSQPGPQEAMPVDFDESHKRMTADYLSSLDTPGIRFLDKFSRPKPGTYPHGYDLPDVGTRNYVMFPQSSNLIDIVNREKAEGGSVQAFGGKGSGLVKGIEALKNYADPAAKFINDWAWRPLADVAKEVPTAVPEHVQHFGDYMLDMIRKAQIQGFDPRDILKAYTSTLSSIQRGAVDRRLVENQGLKLSSDTPTVRPEGAFADWLGSKPGQKYLQYGSEGEAHPEAIADAQEKMANFGLTNTLGQQLRNAPRIVAAADPARISDLVDRAGRLASHPDEWRDAVSNFSGIGPAKAGFFGGILGRGDQPTLDARQILLHSGTPTKEAKSHLGSTARGFEGVDRLAARQEALGLDLPGIYDPLYQHLTHHAIWDAIGNDQTTHKDVIDMMLNRAEGGRIPEYGIGGFEKGIETAGKAIKEVEPFTRKALESASKYSDAAIDEIRRLITKAPWMGTTSRSNAISGIVPRSPYEHFTADYGMPSALSPLPTIRPEDLKDGRIIGAMGDRMNTNLDLYGINDQKFDRPVHMFGGPDYGRGPSGSFWASDKGPIGTYRNIAQRTQEEGLHPFLTPMSMGRGAIDSTPEMTKTLLQMMQDAKIPGAGFRDFNEAMRTFSLGEGKPPLFGKSWPGIKSGRLEDWQLGLPISERQWLAKMMDKASFADQGFPDVAAARLALTSPEALANPLMSSGRLFGRIDPATATTSPSIIHPNYPAQIGGDLVGGFGRHVPVDVMFPTSYAERAAKSKGSALQKSIVMGPLTEDVTPKWIDDMSTWLEWADKNGIPKAKGGSMSEDMDLETARRLAMIAKARQNMDNAKWQNEPHKYFDDQNNAPGYLWDRAKQFGTGLLSSIPKQIGDLTELGHEYLSDKLPYYTRDDVDNFLDRHGFAPQFEGSRYDRTTGTNIGDVYGAVSELPAKVPGWLNAAKRMGTRGMNVMGGAGIAGSFAGDDGPQYDDLGLNEAVRQRGRFAEGGMNRNQSQGVLSSMGTDAQGDSEAARFAKAIVQGAIDEYGNRPYDPNLDKLTRDASAFHSNIAPLTAGASAQSAQQSAGGADDIFKLGSTALKGLMGGKGSGVTAAAPGSLGGTGSGGMFGVGDLNATGGLGGLSGGMDVGTLGGGGADSIMGLFAAHGGQVPRFAQGGGVNNEMLNYGTMFYDEGGKVDPLGGDLGLSMEQIIELLRRKKMESGSDSGPPLRDPEFPWDMVSDNPDIDKYPRKLEGGFSTLPSGPGMDLRFDEGGPVIDTTDLWRKLHFGMADGTLDIPVGRGRATLGATYDPSSRYGSIEGGYEHPVGRALKLGLYGNIGKDLGPEGASARPDWGVGVRGRLPFAEGGGVPEFAFGGLMGMLGGAGSGAAAGAGLQQGTTGLGGLLGGMGGGASAAGGSGLPFLSMATDAFGIGQEAFNGDQGLTPTPETPFDPAAGIWGALSGGKKATQTEAGRVGNKIGYVVGDVASMIFPPAAPLFREGFGRLSGGIGEMIGGDFNKGLQNLAEGTPFQLFIHAAEGGQIPRFAGGGIMDMLGGGMGGGGGGMGGLPGMDMLMQDPGTQMALQVDPMLKQLLGMGGGGGKGGGMMGLPFAEGGYVPHFDDGGIVDPNASAYEQYTGGATDQTITAGNPNANPGSGPTFDYGQFFETMFPGMMAAAQGAQAPSAPASALNGGMGDTGPNAPPPWWQSSPMGDQSGGGMAPQQPQQGVLANMAASSGVNGSMNGFGDPSGGGAMGGGNTPIKGTLSIEGSFRRGGRI